MPLATVRSCAVVGLDGELVDVEVDIARGMPHFTIVGLPDAALQESKERVRSAIQNSGFPFPKQRITVNLAPADLRKEGPAYDLPIAIGILIASQQAISKQARHGTPARYAARSTSNARAVAASGGHNALRSRVTIATNQAGF